MIAEQNHAAPPLNPDSRGRVQDGRIFGVALGQFGLFATLLLSWALGLVAFCFSCFVSIVGLLMYNQLGHHSVDFADTYRYVAFPLGLSVSVMSLFVLLSLWARRKMRGQ